VTGDIAIVWNSDRLGADWTLLPGGDLETAPPLVTAVYVSLFTDARARDDDRLAEGDTDRRGWWGNLLDDQPIGSRLWLLRRAKHLPETLRLARDYIREALSWLLADGIAASLDIAAEWQGASRIAATIVIHRAQGGRETVTASWAWQGA
jgi:phage gp46-like protein